MNVQRYRSESRITVPGQSEQVAGLLEQMNRVLQVQINAAALPPRMLHTATGSFSACREMLCNRYISISLKKQKGNGVATFRVEHEFEVTPHVPTLELIGRTMKTCFIVCNTQAVMFLVVVDLPSGPKVEWRFRSLQLLVFSVVDTPYRTLCSILSAGKKKIVV